MRRLLSKKDVVFINLLLILFFTIISLDIYPATNEIKEQTDENVEVTEPESEVVVKADNRGYPEKILGVITKEDKYDFFDWGLDERIRQEYWRHARYLTKDEHNLDYFRFRTRLWFDIKPAEWISFHTRLTNEFRFWLTEHAASDGDEIVFDNLYLHLKRPFDLPVSLKAGRMDLKYGDGFIIMEGNPLDGSRTTYMDAIIPTLHLDAIKTDIDALIIETLQKDNRLFQINPSNVSLSEDTIRVYGYYLTSKFFDPVQLEQYYLFKDANGSGDSRQLKLNTFGTRFSGKFIENLDLSSEFAFQFGRQGVNYRTGYGTTLDAKYSFPVMFNPAFKIGYMFLSGDNPSTRKREDWDPILSRWFDPNILFWLLLARESQEGNRAAMWSNMHMFHIGGEVSPLEKWKVILEYQKFWADESTYFSKPGFGTGKDRGDMIRVINKLTINKNWTADAIVEYFCPGDYYSRIADQAMYFRWQLNFKY